MPAVILNSKKQRVRLTNKNMFVTRVVRYNTINSDTFLKHVAADSGLSEAVASVAIGAINKQIKQMLLNGHSFPIGNLFYLRYGFNCMAKQTLAEVTARDIHNQRIICRPTKNLTTKLREVRKTIILNGNY